MISATSSARAVMVDPPFFAPQNQRSPSPPRADEGAQACSPRSRRSSPGSASRRRRPATTCSFSTSSRAARREEAVDADGEAGWSLSFDPHFWEKFARLDPVSLVKAARSPLALIRGAKSQLFHPEDAAYLLSLIAPGSPYVEIPEAEHHVMIDQPLAFVAGLRALLAAWPAAKRPGALRPGIVNCDGSHFARRRRRHKGYGDFPAIGCRCSTFDCRNEREGKHDEYAAAE